MKERIFSIMDMSKKKSGIAILCVILILTMGTGFAFAAKTEAQGPPEIIGENIVVNTRTSVSFIPNPDIYNKYSDMGITVSDDGTKLLYEGTPVRLFVDENSDMEAFYLDESGSMNLSIVRNAAGEITGIESITAQKAQEYQDAFFENEQTTIPATQSNDTSLPNKYDQYQPFGITYSSADEAVYFNGQRVKLLVDQYEAGWLGTLWTDDAGTVNLEIIRNAFGQITGIESISEDKAQEYRSSSDEYEQKILNGLDKKIEEKMQKLYPDNY